MCAYTAYVICLPCVVRFPQSKLARLCPAPDRKHKKADDYTESVGQLGLDPPSTYDIQLHFAIAHMRRADGAAFQPSSSGKKAMDLLAGKQLPRCIVFCQLCAR
jgi:hypothetical protein